MYNVKTLSANFVTDGANDDTFQAVTGFSMAFNVEEDEMWCLIKLKACVSNATVNGRADLDVAIDGTRIGGTHGLAGATSSTVNAVNAIHVENIVKLAKGEHKAAVFLKSTTDTQVAKIEGATWAATLEVLRLSNQALLAHGVDAKFQVVQ